LADRSYGAVNRGLEEGIMHYLKDPSKKVDKQLWYKAIKYVYWKMSYTIVPSTGFYSNVLVRRRL
jgi:hypothetical protein